jgi:hypothetical protein
MLRKRTSEEKSAPGTPSGNASSQYRGVSFNTHSQKWKAVITVGRKQYFLGYFSQEVEAARAYDKASLELRGPEAPTNFKYDKAALEAAAKAAAARQANPPPVEAELDDDQMEVEPQCASLEKLDTQTSDSMESVRDVEVELNAVRATLMLREQAIMNSRAQNQLKVKAEELPAEFMCL